MRALSSEHNSEFKAALESYFDSGSSYEIEQLIISKNTTEQEDAIQFLDPYPDLLERVIRSSPALIAYLNDSHASYPNLVDDLVSRSSESYQWLSKKWQSNLEVCKRVIRSNGFNLRLLPKHLQDNEQLVKLAICQSGEALLYASQRLKSTKSIVLDALEQSPRAYEFASDELKQDQKIRYKALSKVPYLVKSLSAAMKKDKEMLLDLLEQIPEVFKFIDESFEVDEDFYVRAIGLCHLNKLYVDNPKIVLTEEVKSILKDQPDLYVDIHETYKNDPEVCLIAISNNISNFSHLPFRLRTDENFLLEALTLNADIYRFLEKKLRSKIAFARRAVQTDGKNWMELPKKLKLKPELIKAAIIQSPQVLDMVCQEIETAFDYIDDAKGISRTEMRAVLDGDAEYLTLIEVALEDEEILKVLHRNSPMHIDRLSSTREKYLNYIG